jgi:hypothetical protein
MISYEQILEAAAAQAGTTRFGDETLFGPALRRLVAAVLEEAALEPPRVLRLAWQYSEALATRAKIEALVAEHPDIREVPLHRPVFVVGLLRTGTTLLHNLLAGHPKHRAPRVWEMRAPVRPKGADAHWEELQVRETQFLCDLLYGAVPEMRQIHPMSATWPDECSRLFRHSFATLLNAIQVRIPGYVSWICETDMVPFYEYYRLQLQILQWQRPSRRLVLKDPFHLWHLPALFRVFPDAEVLFLHRPLNEALPSMASLCHAMHKQEGGHTDAREVGSYVMDLTERGLLPALAFQKRVDSRQITDLSYRELVRDPIATVRRICAAIDSEVTPEDAHAMGRWLEEHPQHSNGRHVYSLEQYGMNAEMVAKRFGWCEDAYAAVDRTNG